MELYGLIGWPLGHSFSKQYFTEKFGREGIQHARFELFPLGNIADLPDLLVKNPDLRGLSVTIPYKESVIPLLHELDETARAVGAVNCIKVVKNRRLVGYNTDVIGFEKSLLGIAPSALNLKDAKALVLGTGGASKAVAFVFQKLGIPFRFVSRSPKRENEIAYTSLHTQNPTLLVNTTPLGTYPLVDDIPPVPPDFFKSGMFVYDLIYNPAETLLLRQVKISGLQGEKWFGNAPTTSRGSVGDLAKPNLVMTNLDFSNTEIAFAHLSDEELKHTAWLFNMMNKPWLVKYGSKLALWAVENDIPLADWAVRKTVFSQFVGGTTLLDSQPSIEKLAKFNALTILDYGAEAKETELDFNHTMNENIRAIDFAARSVKSIPVISTKVTGLIRFGLLERIQSADTLQREEVSEYRNALKRLDAICYHASKKNVSIFIDAEESWIQDSIDHLVWLMMRRYNKQRVVVYNTFQYYRHDRLQFLTESYDRARKEGFLLGAKLVRGAYMDKERARAQELNYEDPINADKAVTDDLYDTALRFCIDHIDTMAVCNASHNAQSAMLQVELMDKKGIPHDHPHTLFSQLYGMSDNVTFNLAKAGFRVAKYLPYGQVKEVIPYLIRRAQENTSVTGDAGRELKLVREEVKRRGI